jgi:hypothetical protein
MARCAMRSASRAPKHYAAGCGNVVAAAIRREVAELEQTRVQHSAPVVILKMYSIRRIPRFRAVAQRCNPRIRTPFRTLGTRCKSSRDTRVRGGLWRLRQLGESGACRSPIQKLAPVAVSLPAPRLVLFHALATAPVVADLVGVTASTAFATVIEAALTIAAVARADAPARPVVAGLVLSAPPTRSATAVITAGFAPTLRDA